MLIYYLKIAWRNLGNRLHAGINILGLATGLATVMIIGLWVYDELAFDRCHQHYDRIVQVMQTHNYSGDIHTKTNLPMPLRDALEQSYGANFKHIVLSSWIYSHILTVGTSNISGTGAFMDTAAPEMLSLHMIRESKEGLKETASIFLSASLARSLFGDADPLDKMLKLDNKLQVKVTGVYEDVPDNSTFKRLQFITPWNLYAVIDEGVKNSRDQWENNSYLLYAQMKDNADITKVSAAIKDLKLQHLSKEMAGSKPVIFLHPMSRWHLYSEFRNGVNTGGRIRYVWMFSIIGAFVLLLACINFMNLSTARAEKRAKEVGVRKAVGSLQRQLITQFFVESLLVSFIAFLLAIGISVAALPLFNGIAGKSMHIPWNSPVYWALGLTCCIVTGLLAGSYPAFYLSSFNPVKVLKGTYKAGRMATVPRKVLVTFQYTVSIVLIVGTIVVAQQIIYSKNRPVGYTNNGLISVKVVLDGMHRHFEAFRQELNNAGVITAITESSSPVTYHSSFSGGLEWRGKPPGMVDNFGHMGVTPSFGKTVGWIIKNGRDFSSDLVTDSGGIILNEAAVKYMGLRQPVGETVTWDKPYTVIGVVKDMIIESPYEQVKPAFFYLNPNAGEVFLLKINPRMSATGALDAIASIYKKIFPEVPFTFKFVDEEYAKKFSDEEHIGKLAAYFAFLAVFISCMGLFGLITYVAAQRTKEIGIRKILGASASGIVLFLFRDFLRLVLIAVIIATPLAWYTMNSWLNNFNYHTALSWWVFALAGIIALLISVLTISHQAIRTAMLNPVKSLRSE